MLPLDYVRLRLSRVWLIGCGALFAILTVQSLAGKYDAREQLVWSWALPTLVPVLSLVLTVLGSDALKPQGSNLLVRTSYYRVALWMSCFYLLLVAAPIFVEPLTSRDNIALFSVSNLWLAPLQGIVIAALTVVFFKPLSDESKTGALPAGGKQGKR